MIVKAKAKSPQEIRRAAYNTLSWIVIIFLLTFVAFVGTLNTKLFGVLEAIIATEVILFWLLIRLGHVSIRFRTASRLEQRYNAEAQFIRRKADEFVKRQTESSEIFENLDFLDENRLLGVKR